LGRRPHNIPSTTSKILLKKSQKEFHRILQSHAYVQTSSLVFCSWSVNIIGWLWHQMWFTGMQAVNTTIIRCVFFVSRLLVLLLSCNKTKLSFQKQNRKRTITFPCLGAFFSASTVQWSQPGVSLSSQMAPAVGDMVVRLR
jgi:hypothetical protein